MIEENEELDLEAYDELEESPQEEEPATAEEAAVGDPPNDVDTTPVDPPDTNQTPSEATSESKSTKKKQKTRKDSGIQALQEVTRIKLSKTEILALQREEALGATFDLDEFDSASPGPSKRKGNKKGKSLNGQSGTATPLSTEPLNGQDNQTDQQSVKSGLEETVAVDASSAATPSETGRSKRDRRKEKEAAKTSPQAGLSTTLVCSCPIPSLSQAHSVHL
jgi:hypothetical protein